MRKLEHPDGRPRPIRPEAPTVTEVFDHVVSAISDLKCAFERDRESTQAQIDRINQRLDELADQTPQVMTFNEAIAYLRIGRSKLYDLIYSGEVRRYGPEHMPRFKRDDLDAFIERHQYEISNAS